MSETSWTTPAQNSFLSELLPGFILATQLNNTDLFMQTTIWQWLMRFPLPQLLNEEIEDAEGNILLAQMKQVNSIRLVSELVILKKTEC